MILEPILTVISGNYNFDYHDNEPENHEISDFSNHDSTSLSSLPVCLIFASG